MEGPGTGTVQVFNWDKHHRDIGQCPLGSLLRNVQHNRIRPLISDEVDNEIIRLNLTRRMNKLHKLHRIITFYCVG